MRTQRRQQTGRNGFVADAKSTANVAVAICRPRTPLRLENKAPHWNENLKCWCLNFRGRVKFASVKNFQLVDAATPSEVVMQVRLLSNA